MLYLLKQCSGLLALYPNTQKIVDKLDASHGEYTEDKQVKKFEEFKTSIISEIAESMKHIIHTEIQGIFRATRTSLRKVFLLLECFQNMYQT